MLIVSAAAENATNAIAEGLFSVPQAAALKYQLHFSWSMIEAVRHMAYRLDTSSTLRCEFGDYLRKSFIPSGGTGEPIRIPALPSNENIYAYAKAACSEVSDVHTHIKVYNSRSFQLSFLLQQEIPPSTCPYYMLTDSLFVVYQAHVSSVCVPVVDPASGIPNVPLSNSSHDDRYVDEDYKVNVAWYVPLMETVQNSLQQHSKADLKKLSAEGLNIQVFDTTDIKFVDNVPALFK